MSDSYPYLLHGPRRRWWKPLVGLAVVLVTAVLLSVAVVLVVSVAGALLGDADPLSDEALSADTPLGLLANNLSIAMILPAVVIGVLLVHRERVGWLSSVEARLRWGLLLRLFAVAMPLVLLFFAASFLLPGESVDADGTAPDAARLAGLLAVILLTTPFQAAAEEYGFRGYLTQAGCSWTQRRAAAVVAAVVTAVLFALAHGVQDAWLFSDRLVFGLVASWLAWRTGGLEAPVALHVANNLVSLGYSAATGTISASLTLSSVDWRYAVLDMAMMLVFAGLAHRSVRRWGVVVRRGEPSTGSSGAGASPLSPPWPVGYPDPRSGTPSHGPLAEDPRGD